MKHKGYMQGNAKPKESIGKVATKKTPLFWICDRLLTASALLLKLLLLLAPSTFPLRL